MSWIEERLRTRLKAHDVRFTAARKALFNTLLTAAKPLTLHECIEKTAAANRASVYRNMKLFEQLQIVQVISAGWKKRFELAPPFASHHHHLHCAQCGKVVSIVSPSLERFIEQVAQQKGFQLHSHTLELTGECPACQGR